MAVSVIQDALHLLRDGASSTAIERLETAVTETPAYAAAYVLLARAYEGQSQWRLARTAWNQAHVLVPHSATVKEGRRRVWKQLQDLQKKERSPSTQHNSHDQREAGGDGHNSAPEDDTHAEAGPASSENERATVQAPRDTEKTAQSLEENRARGRSGREGEPEEADPEARLPSISFDDGPSDLEALRAQTNQAVEQQKSTLSYSFEPEGEPKHPLNETDADLDRLIEDLQAARIPTEPDIDDVPTPDLDDDIEDMVSETLARIYASQQNYHEAARIYIQLASQEPDRSSELLKQATLMRQKAAAQEGGDRHDDAG